jgi:hypothetical protein
MFRYAEQTFSLTHCAGLSSRDAAETAAFRLTGSSRVLGGGTRVLETGVRIVR